MNARLTFWRDLDPDLQTMKDLFDAQLGITDQINVQDLQRRKRKAEPCVNPAPVTRLQAWARVWKQQFGRGAQVPLPTYLLTSGDLPAVGQARLHAPSGYQPHPMHVWPNSPWFRKSRPDVENQTGCFAVQPGDESSEPYPTAQ